VVAKGWLGSAHVEEEFADNLQSDAYSCRHIDMGEEEAQPGGD
jgi:hypothetical protein